MRTTFEHGIVVTLSLLWAWVALCTSQTPPAGVLNCYHCFEPIHYLCRVERECDFPEFGCIKSVGKIMGEYFARHTCGSNLTHVIVSGDRCLNKQQLNSLNNARKSHPHLKHLPIHDYTFAGAAQRSRDFLSICSCTTNLCNAVSTIHHKVTPFLHSQHHNFLLLLLVHYLYFQKYI